MRKKSTTACTCRPLHTIMVCKLHCLQGQSQPLPAFSIQLRWRLEKWCLQQSRVVNTVLHFQIVCHHNFTCRQGYAAPPGCNNDLRLYVTPSTFLKPPFGVATHELCIRNDHDHEMIRKYNRVSVKKSFTFLFQLLYIW